jgi:protein associated with RNAse G/E
MNTFTINSRKYDQKIRKSWKCRFIEQVDSMMVFIGEFDEDVAHPGLGPIARGTVSREYYWLDRWYNIFRFSEPDGKFRNFYCNVAMPPDVVGETLDYIDLDIDLIVWPDKTVETLDEDDFAANSARFNYPESVKMNAFSAVQELRHLIEIRQFPFDIETFPS